MTGPLLLSDDDYPGAFAARKLELQARVRVSDRDGVLVSITPEIVNVPGGPLATAILLPRGLQASIEELWRGTLSGSMRVFVCRIKHGVDQAKQAYAWDEVINLIWGEVVQRKC